MALATLSTTVDRVVTDRRIWTDIIASHGLVNHWWSLVKPMTRRNPNSGLLDVLPRIGNQPLTAGAGDDPQMWRMEGGYEAAYFDGYAAGATNNIDYRAAFPKPADAHSFVVIRNSFRASTRDWGINTTASPTRISNNPARNGNSRSINVISAGDNRLDFGSAALDVRDLSFTTIDFASGDFTVSALGVNPVTRNFSGMGDMLAQWDENNSLIIGEGAAASQPYEGVVLDFLWVNGDIHATSHAELRADLTEYFNTVYQG